LGRWASDPSASFCCFWRSERCCPEYRPASPLRRVVSTRPGLAPSLLHGLLNPLDLNLGLFDVQLDAFAQRGYACHRQGLLLAAQGLFFSATSVLDRFDLRMRQARPLSRAMGNYQPALHDRRTAKRHHESSEERLRCCRGDGISGVFGRLDGLMSPRLGCGFVRSAERCP